MPIQQMLLGVSGAKKIYQNDVFNINAYKGTGLSKLINSGIDLSGEGGLVWTKNRDQSDDHQLCDTVRGNAQYLISHSGNAQQGEPFNRISAFNSNGHTLQATAVDDTHNKSGESYISWIWRKAPGFFDVVQYTGTGSSRTVAHSLGSIPGMIMVKRTDATADWRIYHRDIGNADAIKLNSTATSFSSGTTWGSTDPTSTHFTVNHNETNASAGTFIAYVFAGGESTAATARSVDYDGSDDNTVWQSLSGDNADDLTFGTGDFTVEGWAKPDSIANYPAICDFRDQTAG